jgi:ABC-type antimicrobial peptide transport system permease subunit
MEKYKKLQNETAPPDWAISSFAFEQLANLPHRAGSIRNSISGGSDDNYKSVVFLLVIGAFMLILACFNYINIAIVSAAKRLKEIGIRKSVGATRRTLIVQFLTENIVTTFFALILGILFGIFVAIPWFEDINHFSMGFTLKDTRLWIYLPIILLLTGILSGLYPSLYISKFEVVGILKGSVKFGMKNPLTKVFLVFQLILACILITSAVMFTQNTSYLSRRSWGYDQKAVLYTSVPDASAFEKLSALMKQDPDVITVSGSEQHLGKNNSTAVVHFPDHQFEVDQFLVEGNYFETMGLQVAAGRAFRDNYESDKKAIVVNELFAKSMSVKHPVGQMVKIDSLPYQIVGIVNDFHSHSFHRKIKPAIFRVADKENYQYLSMKIRPGTENKTYKTLQTRWTQLFPEIPFDGGFQEDIWGNYYEQIGVHAKVWKAIAAIAVLLTCLGLYGLVKLNIAGRVREFSIRKVLGAGFRDMTYAITRQYIFLLVVALVIATPLSWFLTKKVIELAYSYHMPITFAGVTIAITILVGVVLLTLSTQIMKVVKSNPLNGLKTE